jgi:hypothetical protein
MQFVCAVICLRLTGTSEVAICVLDYPIIVSPLVWTGFIHFNMEHIGSP